MRLARAGASGASRRVWREPARLARDTVDRVLALILVAASVGLDNFAASIGLGTSGTSNLLRLQVGIVFGVFEAGMPVLGLLLGQHVAHTLGGAAKPIGGVLLAGVGIYSLWTTRRGRGVAHDEAASDDAPESARATTLRLMVVGVALSIDNLVVGFALGDYHVALAVAAAVFAVFSVTLSLAGLELGGRLGKHFGDRSEYLGGGLLVVLGLVIGTGVI